jgi:hypothetical protein
LFDKRFDRADRLPDVPQRPATNPSIRDLEAGDAVTGEPEMEVGHPPLVNRRSALVFCAVFGIAFGFALYTRHAWEDYYITYRCSKNLATGHGMVFTPGERVHAFTSPLNTLIPAAMSAAIGNRSDRLVLWLFRVFSAGALAGAAVLFYQIAQTLSLRPLATLVWIGLLATGPAIVDFSINGQETGMMMFFLALSLHALIVPTGRYRLRLGLAWTGLMWTRPDSCVYIAAIAVAFFLFAAGAPGQRGRWELFKTYLVAGALTTALYLPWVLWAWSYFGSPVPHTVIAKGLNHPTSIADLWERTLRLFAALCSADFVALSTIFAPPYSARLGPWPTWMHVGCGIMTWIGALYWLLPFGERRTRALSLVFFLGVWYIFELPISYPWYLPNAAIFGLSVIGLLVHQLAQILSGLENLSLRGETAIAVRHWFVSRGRFVLGTAGLATLAFSLVMLLMCAFQMRIQQREVESGNRRQIGLWLRANARTPHDSVFLESLGYIGFFSQLKMLDWPGLCSREVVASRQKRDSWPFVIQDLRPDWLVLRPIEVAVLEANEPRVLGTEYVVAQSFDVSAQIKAYPWIPGRLYPEYDQHFIVFRRITPKNATPAAASNTTPR